MTPAEILSFAGPISDDAPAGPDLEMEGDTDYMRYVARIEAVLPKSFASFDRGSIEFEAEFTALRDLLGRSRDLRLTAVLAKLHILNRDLAGFAAACQLCATLLDGQWEHVHPQLLDGDAILRVVSLQTLDDMADCVMPLQAAPLFDTRRFGKASYRSHLLASGAIQARSGGDGEKGEDVPAADAMKTALVDADIAQLVASRGLALDIRDAAKKIESVMDARSGQFGALRFERLTPLAAEIVGFLDQAVGARDPSLALAGGQLRSGDDAGDGQDESSTAPSGAILTHGDADRALLAAQRYFQGSEPSSPVVLLIAQAQSLIGKSFFDAMQSLIPDITGQAAIRFGRDTPFRLPVERLSALVAPVEADAGDAAAAGDESSDDGWSSGGDDAGSGSDAGDGEAAADQEGDGQSHDGDGSRGGAPSVGAPAHSPKLFHARNRQDAVSLLDQVAAYFRSVEPSSPIPTLLDQGRTLAGRDFFALLREVLPASALRVDD